MALSLFPGLGLLDMAFEDLGFTVVRGPDVLWGGDIRRFHVPAGRFEGIIGGPPCQTFSKLAALQRWAGREPKFGNLVPEFSRCVLEGMPLWALMENVEGAPLPELSDSYRLDAITLNNRWVAGSPEQNRRRRFTLAVRQDMPQTVSVWQFLDLCLFEAPLSYGPPVGHSPAPGQRLSRRGKAPAPVTSAHTGDGRPRASFAVTARHAGRMPWHPKAPGAVTSSDGGPAVRMTRYRLPEACVLQGLPEHFLDDSPFTAEGKLRAVANGVPLPMGRAIAKAVRCWLESQP